MSAIAITSPGDASEAQAKPLEGLVFAYRFYADGSSEQPLGHGDIRGITYDLVHVDRVASAAARASDFKHFRGNDLADQFHGDFRDRIDHAGERLQTK